MIAISKDHNILHSTYKMLSKIPTDIVNTICSYVGDISINYQLKWHNITIKDAHEPVCLTNIPLNIIEYWYDKGVFSRTHNFAIGVRMSMNKNLTIPFIEKYFDCFFQSQFARNPIVSSSFYEKYIDKLGWEVMPFSRINLSWEFIQQNMQYFNWRILSASTNIPIEEFERHINLLCWHTISSNPSIPLWFYEKYINQVRWPQLSSNPSIPVWFYEKYIQHVNWRIYCKEQIVSVDFLTNHIECIEWWYLCSNASVPIEFLERHINRINWESIEWNPSLPEWFIEKYVDRFVSLEWMYGTYPFSLSFLEKHLDRLTWSRICRNPHIPICFFEQHIECMDWNEIFNNPTTPAWFYEKYRDKIPTDRWAYNEKFIQYLKDKENIECIHKIFYG